MQHFIVHPIFQRAKNIPLPFNQLDTISTCRNTPTLKPSAELLAMKIVGGLPFK